MNFIELIDNEEIPQSEIIELAGAPTSWLASDNWHLNTEENREQLTELSEESAGGYDYQLFALVDDGRREGPVWFPVKIDWRGGLEQDPIPGWALRAALSHLIDEGAIVPDSSNSKGQTWLANQLGRTPRSVRMWIDGSRNCSGLAADAVRRVIEDALS